MKKFIALFLLFLSISANPAYAKEFATSYIINYSIDENANTKVEYDIELENLTSEYYATEYSLGLTEDNIIDISATQDNQKIEVEFTNTKEKSNVTLKLIKSIVGKGKTTKLNLQFTSDKLISKKGSVYELTIPKLVATESLNTYKVILNVHNLIGNELYIFPQPLTITKKDDYKVFEFSGDGFKGSGINAVFGEFQLFNVNLKYHLKNPTSQKVKQDITIPPDIRGRQNIVIKNISKIPNKIYSDQDGNYFAEYYLEQSEEKIIDLNLEVKVLNLPFKEKLVDPKIYTSSQPFWEKNSEIVTQTLKTLNLNPADSDTVNAKKIFQFVTNHLQYNLDKASNSSIEREGVEYALTNPTDTVCMEFSDSFITLARAAGISAREINGYAYTSGATNKPLSLRLTNSNDILHSWAEYYSETDGWVQVDPTWASTSGLDFFTQFDTNHITFVTHGINSNYPYPAGSFKIDPEEDNFINVDFISEQTVPVEYKFEARKVLKSNILDMIRLKTELVLINKSNTTVYNVKIGDNIVAALPPFAQVSLQNTNSSKISFETFTGKEINSEITIENNQYLPKIILPIISFLVALALFLYVIFRK
jgi:hypothetical protein